MVSVMPPFGGHLGSSVGASSSAAFGGSDGPVELAGGSRYHFSMEVNTASSLASSAVAYENRPISPPFDDPDKQAYQQGYSVNLIINIR